MSLTRSLTFWRYLLVGALIVSLAVAIAIASVGQSGGKVPFGGAPNVNTDQPIDSTRLGKIGADERARIALDPRNAGANDVECVGECGP